MARHHLLHVIACAALLTAPAAAQGRPPSQPTADNPELAALGHFKVGVTHTRIEVGQRPLIGPDGRVSMIDRMIDVRIWYPATPAASGAAVSYRHVLPKYAGGELVLETPGMAIEGAQPIEHTRFPLVVVSHGLGGWDTTMTYLTENLASKGYVVAAIDHADASYRSVPQFLAAFANVEVNRASDQRAVIRSLKIQATATHNGWAALIDPAHVGLIGYSMGGFGALATAGAAYDPQSPTLKKLPAALARELAQPEDDVAGDLGALVAIAPWGAQPSERAWSPSNLAAIKAPTLMIDGSQDDTVDYARGVKWVFGHLANTERRLLVFEGAGHGVGVNPAPPETLYDIETSGYFTDPVWRTERLNGISVHFITAFLDACLKNDATRLKYLDTPTTEASDSSWPRPFGDLSGPRYAGDGQPRYWRGFQRGQAVQLELLHMQRGAVDQTP